METEGALGPSTALRKAFAVLTAFDDQHRALTLSAMARRCGLPKSTVHRLARVLVELGVLEKEADTYRVGKPMFTLGWLAVDPQLRDVALPHLERLRRMTGRSIHFAALRGTRVQFLEVLPAAASPVTPAQIGGIAPASVTGVGRVLLAHSPSPLPEDLAATACRTPTGPRRLDAYLTEVRAQGYALDLQDWRVGVHCVAVRLGGSSPQAAVSVVLPAGEADPVRHLRALQETAVALGRDLSLQGAASDLYAPAVS